MKILLVSDEEDKYLWDYYTPGRLKGIDLILSAGDLKAEYLSFLVTMANRPLLYVHGNHDGGYAQRPPEGCQCIDGKLVTVGGLRILGLGGSALYNGGPHQYTEKQMRRRIHRLRLKLALTSGVDIVLTHAPVRGFGDEDNMTHRGFEAFLPLLDQYQPRYLVHGHIHQRYGANRPRCYQYNETTIVNATGRYILEFPDKPGN
ncbi:MAG: metallophosphoesterase family protein [Candidatus Limivicinus sp.]|nr:metallophosphoesterase family protein [Candidatus Limivicinus sp.]